MPLSLGLPVVAAHAVQAPVGEGFTVSASDLSYILKQIKIAENHVAKTTPATGPCGALVGTGPNQLASPLLSRGLRTVDGSCNNLQPDQGHYGAADQVFPRLTKATYSAAEPSMFAAPGAPASTYNQTSGDVFDSEPRIISNLIVDQTSANPAAVAAAGHPVRTQGNKGLLPCTTDPQPNADPPVTGVPADCVPKYDTMFIPNVTTDVGLSPPYNSMFTLFGQFFDHGVDQTVKGGGTVYIPMKADDPLISGPDHIKGNADDLPAHLRFMVMTRGQNQPGDDGVLGTADDVKDALNTDSPWVDQSQTYSSHSSHQVFLREYENAEGRPVSTGKMLGGTGANADGMATWASTKAQAATLLGIQLLDTDVTNVPMLAADAYGNFIPGPARGLPQFVTGSGLVEADRAANDGKGTLVPDDVQYFDTPFLTDIAHNADPSPKDTDHNPRTPAVVPTPDADSTPSADFADQAPGTYDDEMLNEHFIAGDGRVNENIGLTAIHQVFHSEHDRLVDDIKVTLAANPALLAGYQAAGTFDFGERLFQAARFVTEMEYQHIVFEDFARKVQPGINPFEPFAFTETDVNPAVTAEFAHAVYRFGHSMLTDTISRKNEYKPGSDGEYGTVDDIAGTSNDISLLEGFLNPPAYYDGGDAGVLAPKEAAGSVVMGMADQVGNELDEFVTDTLRNNLLGLPLDLATVNITRARSEGIPSLNNLRKELHAETNDGQLKPYVNWIDFGENLKHPESLVNFVAAYGTHPSITGATTVEAKRAAAQLLVKPATIDGVTAEAPADAAAFLNSTGDWASKPTGLNDVDLWVGGLAERTNMFGGLLGSTFNYVFEQQMTNLQNADRLYYLARTPGMNLRAQLEGNSFAELVMRNTNAQALKADAFATADCEFELKNLNGTPGGFDSSGNTVADDVATDCDETALLLRMPDGTIKYRAINSVDPSGINGQSVYNGTANADRVYGGNDNDTFWGGNGNDVIEGGDGADVALGGNGNDIITDLNGDDVPKGGPGNDAIDGGPGLDILMGGDGSDFTNGGENANETFLGEGDDLAIGGKGIDAVFGDGGNDWIEGGESPDLLIGDSSNLFFQDDSQKPGHDVLIGQGGDDDYDMEGGNDVGLAGPGVEKVAGASGYDFEIGLSDPQKQDADLDLPILGLDVLQVGVRDRYNEVEGLSGGALDDTLRGDDVIPSEVGGGGFIGCDVFDQDGVNMVEGLDELITSLPTPLAEVEARTESGECQLLSGNVWGDGNILLGGGGNDLIEGRGADDILDGDRYYNVRLSVRDAADRTIEIGSATGMTAKYLKVGGVLAGQTLQEAVFAGKVDPGNIVVVREILTAPGGSDTAVFSDAEANYTVSTTPAGAALGSPGSVTTVTHDDGGADGTDTLRNIENLRFSDTPIPPPPPTVVAPGVPTLGAITGGNGRATVAFSAAAAGGTPTGFTVRVVDAANAQVGALRTAPAGATALVIDGLTNGTAYRFQVRATNDAGTSAYSALSASVTPAVPPLTTAVPSITGIAKVGSVLTANTGIWGPAPVSFTYQWFSGGAAISGATAATYTVAAPDAGKAVTVRVTGSKTGYAPATTTSAPITVAAIVPPANRRDYNGDGRGDLLARDASGVLWTYLGNGAGTFPTRVRVGSGWGAMNRISAAGDLTGDGKADLVARDASGVLWTYRGSGTGTFPTRVQASGGWGAMTAISVAGDLTGDGKADLVARDASGILWTYRGSGTGTFPTRVQVGGGWGSMTAITAGGDLTGDGKADLVARDASGILWTYRGSGTGTFPTRIQGSGGWRSMTAISVTGDLTGDGKADLVARDASGILWTYRGSGSGTFANRLQVGTGWQTMTAIS